MVGKKLAVMLLSVLLAANCLIVCGNAQESGLVIRRKMNQVVFKIFRNKFTDEFLFIDE